MSRVGKLPVVVPQGVDVSVGSDVIRVKGKGAELSTAASSLVRVELKDGCIVFAPVDASPSARAMFGTMRQLVANMVKGVNEGFEKKLTLVGVGYKAAVQGDKLALNVGYSHPVILPLPQGVSATTPAPTEVVLKGADRQRVGQFAAEVRAIRPPEPYKGKGIRYADEKVVIKETKKK